jgi:hypothetical protein
VLFRSPGDVDRLLADAAAAWSRRPARASVDAARDGYLAAARADESRVEGLLGAAKATGWLVEHERDAATRLRLATEGVQACQWCQRRSPSSIACTYQLALALGQFIREKSSTAIDGLKRIVAMLEEVIAKAPTLDRAGGHRVLALVLLRAPGWPAGPGDADEALEHARQADALAPGEAVNLLVLAEAQEKTGDRAAARATYQRARTLAAARAEAGDPDAVDQVEQSDAALKAPGRQSS